MWKVEVARHRMRSRPRYDLELGYMFVPAVQAVSVAVGLLQPVAVMVAVVALWLEARMQPVAVVALSFEAILSRSTIVPLLQRSESLHARHIF